MLNRLCCEHVNACRCNSRAPSSHPPGSSVTSKDLTTVCVTIAYPQHVRCCSMCCACRGHSRTTNAIGQACLVIIVPNVYIAAVQICKQPAGPANGHVSHNSAEMLTSSARQALGGRVCSGAVCLPGLCGVNVNSLDPIGALKEMPLQEGGVRHSATMALAQTYRTRNRGFSSSITKKRARLAITLTSSRRGCGDSSNRSSAHLIHSQILRLHLQACQQA